MHSKLLVALLTSLAASAPAAAAEPRNEAAVIAADSKWLDAELSGNGNYLNELLLPEYLSIGADGKITTGAQIVTKARSRTKQELAALAANVASWKAAHPIRPSVTIVGDTAILKWMSTLKAVDAVGSCDIFIYRGGHWHALYSQHTSAST